MTQRTVLITGATGNQGGAVARATLDNGWKVRALVRNLDSAKAQALAAAGAELAHGSFDDGDSIVAAAQGVDAAFVNTSPFAPGVGVDGEVRQNGIILQALRRAAVPHVVYSSVSDADRNTGVPHFDSKAAAEKILAETGLPATVTGPVFFSDNVIAPWNLPGIAGGLFRHAMPGERPLQVVSVRDIGRFNAAVLERGVALAGRRINYAGIR